MSAMDGSGTWRIEREKDAFAYKVDTVVSVTNGESRATYTTRRVNHAYVAELKDVAADLPRLRARPSAGVADAAGFWYNVKC